MAGNDLSIRAGNNVSQVGSDLSADNDVWISAGGTFVSVAAAQREVIDRIHEELRIGITVQVSSGALATAQTIARAVDRIGTGRGSGESITNAVAIAQIAGTGANYVRGVTDAYIGPVGGAGNNGAAAVDRALGLSASISFGARRACPSVPKMFITQVGATTRWINSVPSVTPHPTHASSGTIASVTSYLPTLANNTFRPHDCQTRSGLTRFPYFCLMVGGPPPKRWC